MVVLSKENMEGYLRGRYPAFCGRGPLSISEIGDSEGDNPGLINHIFRADNGAERMIVKQGQEQIRAAAYYRLPPGRNRQEYLSLKLRGAIVPQYVPKVYGSDPENNAFCMEDVSYLRNARVELSRGVMLPELGRRCAEYIAAAGFYTSEFFLDTPTFRSLSNTFTNTDMRRVMEHWLFMCDSPFPDSPDMAWLRKGLEEDGALMAEIYQLRHQFMSRPEALIHADLHTSNLFLDEERLKVIDMEYTFAGPICYDVGYFVNSIFTQYCSSCLRPFPSEGERRAFQAYLLGTIADTYERFVSCFLECWDRDAKDYYRACPAWRDRLVEGFLPDILGYAGVPTFAPILSGGASWLDFNVIPDPEDRLNAKYLAVLLSRRLILQRFRYRSMADVIADTVEFSHRFLRELGRR